MLALALALASALLLSGAPALAQEATGYEPANVQAVPGDGSLTVTWEVNPRNGYADDEIRHALRWSQEPGVWANPDPDPDSLSLSRNDGITAPAGVASYTITGLENGVATGVFVRSYTGDNPSETAEGSSPWVRTKGEHTTPRAGQQQSEPEPAKTFSVSATASAVEGGNAALTITLSEADGVAFTVTPGYSGSADSGDVGSVVSPVAVPEGSDTLTISIPTVGDAVDEDDETFTVTVAAATNGWEPAGDGPDTATVTIIDDDTAGVTITPTTLNVAEDGSVTYTAVLDSQPTADVTVTPTSSDDGAARVAPASHTFTPAGWNIAQEFMVSGVSDDDTNDESVGVSHSLASNDGKYVGVPLASVTVAVADTTPAPAEQQQQQEPAPEPPTPGQTEPYNVQVVPGDGMLTVTWTVTPREGYADDEIRHALRWSQFPGVWANPPDPEGPGPNDGITVAGGVNSYVITGLKNGVATGVFVRSFVGSSLSERSEHSSEWVRTKGDHTTPRASHPQPVLQTPEPQPQQQDQTPAVAQDDATLSDLKVYIATSAGQDSWGDVPIASPAYAVSPAVSSSVTEYEVRVPEGWTADNALIEHPHPISNRVTPNVGDSIRNVAVVITPTAGDQATIAVSGKRALGGGETGEPNSAPKSGQTSGPWGIGVGYNWVDIVVTAPDGQTKQNYTVKITQGYVKPPENVQLTPGDAQLELTWDAPAEDLPWHYFARWRVAGTQTWLNTGQRAFIASGLRGAETGEWIWSTALDKHAPLEYTITGLENGEEYEVFLTGVRGGSRHPGETVKVERKEDYLESPWVAAAGTGIPDGTVKLPLTITPTSPTRAYGESDDLSYTVGGLATGDAAADVVGGALARAPGDDAGSYAINLGTLAVKTAYAAKYSLPAAPAVATYTITPKAITAISGVTVNSRASDGTTDAAFDTSNADGTGVLPSELADFRAGGLLVSGAFPAATPGTHSFSVTYALQDHGSFKAANYTLASTTDTLRGEITEAGIHLSSTQDDGVLRVSEGRMIGDSSLVGFTKLIRPVTITQGMSAIHYIALKHPPTADVTIYLKTDPPSFFEKNYSTQRSAHFSASSYQPGGVGEPLGYVVTHDAIGTFTITHVGVSDDPRYNGDLDTLTVQVIRAKPGECRTLAAPSVTMNENGEVWATAGPATCAGRIVDGYQLEVSENGGPWKFLDNYVTPRSPGHARKPTSKSFGEATMLPDTATRGVEYRVRGRGHTSRPDAGKGKFSTDWLTTRFTFTGEPAVIVGAPVRQPGAQLPNGRTDYDVDNDGLIEVSTLAHLNAMRWDPDGNGYAHLLEPYAAAFPDAMNGMGCPSSWCSGYELVNDLDFDTNGNGEDDAGDAYWNGGAGWNPVGVACCPFSGVFEGNGNVIRNLYIKRTATEWGWWRDRTFNNSGLFGASRGVIRNVGLESVNITGRANVGGLAGMNRGKISGSYVTGSVTGLHAAGGLVGLLFNGTIAESYSTASVVGPMPQSWNGKMIGGLVGFNDDGAILASYAAGRVSGQASTTGGLIGYGTVKSSVAASYSTSSVSSNGSLTTGLSRGGTDAVSSYWDTQTSGQSGRSLGEGKTTAELQTPTGYTGIYANWNLDLDGDGNADDPWDFGTDSQYPVLKNAGPSVAGQRPETSDNPAPEPADSPPAFGDRDYDADDDGLIDVSGLAQLNAIRWDLDGDGSVSNNEYYAYFSDAMAGMGCPSSGCVGYELTASLDFDTDASGGANSADAYWNGGAGWTPIGYGPDDGPIDHGAGDFSATFEGNDFTIRNLFVSSTGDGAGLFSGIASGGTVRNLTLESVGVTAVGQVGGLVGQNAGSISGVSVSGAVTGRNAVGGVAGASGASGVITDSHATASVTGTKPRSEDGRHVGGLVGYNEGAVRSSYATGDVSGKANNTGGLVGFNSGSIIASYAHLDVTGSGRYIGGLAGSHYSGTITASYAAGTTAGGTDVGGLVGHHGGTITASYWDSDESQATGTGGVGKTTAELQTPTDYTGIYANWNVDLDGDGNADDPWDFGASSQYPTLKMKRSGQRAQAPGNQAPTVSAATADATIASESSTHEVSLSGVFDDADGDALTVTAASDDEAVATVSVAADSSTLTVTAKARGTATITVTADDGNGGTVSDTFTVTVKAGPMVASALADVPGLEVAATQDVSLSGLFQDADGDSLTITAASSNDGVVSAFVFQETLTILAIAEGTVTITVTAEDTDSNTVSDAFDVSVVAETAPAPPPPGQIEPYNVQVTPGDGTLTVTWTVAPREGFDAAAMSHALRWSQESGVWANPPGPSGAPEDGIVVEGGVASYTITGLENGVATGVFVRSFTGGSYSERSEDSSKWVRTKGDHTTPKAAE